MTVPKQKFQFPMKKRLSDRRTQDYSLYLKNPGIGFDQDWGQG